MQVVVSMFKRRWSQSSGLPIKKHLETRICHSITKHNQILSRKQQRRSGSYGGIGDCEIKDRA